MSSLCGKFRYESSNGFNNKYDGTYLPHVAFKIMFIIMWVFMYCSHKGVS